jgi:predicted CoA-binding protein
VIPVNPRERRSSARRSYKSLPTCPVPIDIVNVFRARTHCPAIAEEAVKVGAGSCGASSA